MKLPINLLESVDVRSHHMTESYFSFTLTKTLYKK
jgi:hypothetical protein